MVRYLNKNKNELLVLTGAVYSFVAYLTAFTLEVLFIIDLAKQVQPAPPDGLSAPISNGGSPSAASSFEDTIPNPDEPSTVSAFHQARLALESMQTHLTISCLAISVLYFLTFVGSLLLVVALILRSTFMLLAWMCTMATLYLPEFGLIVYVSIFGWGIDSRNGQTELIFYLFRAALNVIFVYRAHKLWKDWNYEKNFFLFSKSSKRFSAATYDSPYFIHGDSLSTTINPVFSSSTLHLDRYDQIRDNLTDQSRYFNSDKSSFRNNNNNNDHNPENRHSYDHSADSRYSRANNTNYDLDDNSPRKNFYLGNESNTPTSRNRRASSRPIDRQNSVLSINEDDEFADCEMDLDYRTLTQQRHYSHGPMIIPPAQTTHHQQADHYQESQRNLSGHYQPAGQGGETLGRLSPSGLSYSTQSLDRRHLKDMELNLPEQVILRPLGHQPFDYLYRPGSSSNLTSNTNLNTHLTLYSSSSRLTKRDDFN